jgi:hypothetical protein
LSHQYYLKDSPSDVDAVAANVADAKYKLENADVAPANIFEIFINIFKYINLCIDYIKSKISCNILLIFCKTNSTNILAINTITNPTIEAVSVFPAFSTLSASPAEVIYVYLI